MSGRHNGRGGLRGEIDELMGENCEEREQKERIDHSKIASSVLRIGKIRKRERTHNMLQRYRLLEFLIWNLYR